MATDARPADDARALERLWWQRTLAVLWQPRTAYAALRDGQDRESYDARQEPLLAVLWLAGIAGVLGTNAAAHLFDDFEITGVLVAVWAFLAGGIYAAALYLAVSLLLYLGTDLAGALGDYRRARHVVGLAAAPLALSLALWPVRLGLYGGDLFRSYGSDTGAGNEVFEALELVFLAWSAWLLVLGTRIVYAWPLRRTLAACAPPLVLPLLALLRAFGAL